MELPQAAAADPGRPGRPGEGTAPGWHELEEDIFSEDFLLTRPLLEAIRADEPVVLLVDEVDRVELETEALLLEVLSEYQVSIPELGTVRATQLPMVFLTSNNTRELSEALKRRCLYLHIDYPDLDRERAIVRARVPGHHRRAGRPGRPDRPVAAHARAAQGARRSPRPSTGPGRWWCSASSRSTPPAARDTLHILLKYQTDIERAAKELLSAAEPDRHARPPLGVRRRAPPGRAAGLADRAPRRGRGRAPRPAGGPRGAQVRARGDAREVERPLAGLRDRLRDLLRQPAPGGRADGGEGRPATTRRPTGRASGRTARPRPGPGRGRVAKGCGPRSWPQMLYRALRSGDQGMAAVVARQAVNRYAGMEPGRPVGGTYYLYRTLRNLDLDGVLERLMAPEPAGTPSRLTGLEERLLADEYRARIEKLRRGRRERDPAPAGRGPRRRGAGPVGAQAATRGHRRHARDPGGAGRPAAGPAPALAQARRPAGPQASARAPGAARLPGHRPAVAVDRRRAGRAALPPSPPGQARDLRDRRHLGLGGVVRPLHPAPRLRHQLAVLQGPQLRLRRRHRRGDPVLRAAPTTRPWPCTGSTPRPTSSGSTGTPTTATRSAVFNQRWGDQITSRASVLILGDARNNYHATEAWVLGELRIRPGTSTGSTPSRATTGASGDSVVAEYARPLRRRRRVPDAAPARTVRRRPDLTAAANRRSRCRSSVSARRPSTGLSVLSASRSCTAPWPPGRTAASGNWCGRSGRLSPG